jgi:AAA+ superfamily predicted ATPase
MSTVREPAARSYLARPFARATLADHRALELNLRRTGDPFEDEVVRFLGAEDREVVQCTGEHPLYDLPQLHRALADCFPQWQAVAEGGSDTHYRLWAPKHRRVEIAPGRFAHYLSEGTRFYRLPHGRARVALFDLTNECGATVVSFTLLGPRRERDALEAEVRALRRRMRRRHYLRGQAIRADGTLLRRGRKVTWDDVVLEPGLRQALLANVVDFLRLRRTFRRNGVPQKRGVMLYGPPGNGKTMIGRVLAGLGQATFIYLTAGDIRQGAALREAFRMARKTRPAILFLEDLDFYANDRRDSFDRSTLGELLAQMDGVDRNDGLVVVATTNDLAAIEPALRDRPSRFDVVLEVRAPSAECRRELLRRHLPAAFADGPLAERAVALTSGLSGAQLRETALLVVQQAILRGAVDDAGLAQPAEEDLATALARLPAGRRAPIGFHAMYPAPETTSRAEQFTAQST